MLICKTLSLKCRRLYGIFLFVRYRFDYSSRQRMDFALCGGRQGGAAPLTPATFVKVD